MGALLPAVRAFQATALHACCVIAQVVRAVESTGLWIRQDACACLVP
jgi:hypothetical protein